MSSLSVQVAQEEMLKDGGRVARGRGRDPVDLDWPTTPRARARLVAQAADSCVSTLCVADHLRSTLGVDTSQVEEGQRSS